MNATKKATASPVARLPTAPNSYKDMLPMPRTQSRRGASFSSVVVVTTLAILGLVNAPESWAASGPVSHTNYNSVPSGGSSDGYWRHQEKEQNRVTYVPDPSGTRGVVQQFTVLPGDTNVFGSSSKGERAEVTADDLGGFTDDQVLVMSWSTLIASDFASPPGGWNSFVQVHAAGGGNQAPVALSLEGDGAVLKMSLFGGGQWIPNGQPEGAVEDSFDLGPLSKNRWHDFALEVRFGCAGNGYARLWVDGKPVIDAQDRAIGYCGDPFMYWKQGFYRSAYDKPTQIWFDNTFHWKSINDAVAHYGWAADNN
jgi:hypothetical protein